MGDGMSTQHKILLSRFLTRFGDQAWDFAVPLVLIQLFPGKIQLISILYLFSKIAQIFIGPSLSRKIDQKKRITIYKMGIGYQTIAMILMWLLISALIMTKLEENYFLYIIVLVLFSLFSAMANLGSSLMDTSVGFDLAVDVLPEDKITIFNSRLKRLDLIAEVTSPIFTGLVLSLFYKKSEIYGFSIIALLNILTFLPEYHLLKSIPNLDKGKIFTSNIHEEYKSSNFIFEFIESMKKLKDKPYAVVIISYALLWLSILSPHGVLLTSYLKDGAKISEFTIGLFRGLGAFFGLVPTFLYPYIKIKYGMVKASKLFLSFQFICVLASSLSFYYSSSIYPFLIFILFSRIGLYGFSIGETELRQTLIPKKNRGEMNGVANSITSMATLLLFLMGSLLGNTANFGMMIIISISAVFVSLILSTKINSTQIRSHEI
jgi:iron-regulated transporter 1